MARLMRSARRAPRRMRNDSTERKTLMPALIPVLMSFSPLELSGVLHMHGGSLMHQAAARPETGENG
jgi:hypothetical protein